MKEGIIIKEVLNELNVNKIIRFFFPGIYIFARYNTNVQEYWRILFFCATVLFIYPLYKSTYWIFIRKILSFLNWIPQLTWHRKQVEKFTFSNPKDKKYYSSFSICSTCISSCVNMINDKNDEKLLKSIELQNTVAHILYMTSFISLCILLFRAMNLIDNNWFIKQNYQNDLLLAVISLLAGVMYDRKIADLRELSLLKKYKKQYQQILKNLIER